MELYDRVSQDIARLTMLRYSTSFGLSSRLFDAGMRGHIFNVYGLVRIADEVVDTYMGDDAPGLLTELETQTYAALKSGYSTNPIVHAFALTAREYGIGRDLIKPFFASMRMDLTPQHYDHKLYRQYIHGSAEVVGLMCLKVFVGGDKEQYAELAPGAARLGAAFQKVNFLRDLAADSQDLGRFYFPGYTLATFDEEAKLAVIDDIRQDFAEAVPALRRLPRTVRRAVGLSATYYLELLHKLDSTPIEVIKQSRLRVKPGRKLALMAQALLKEPRR
ncbi:phytoene/squalene synthase family protein [Candidatus Saccharibacteria bacterium]|nr:phytoene/squalene synthase family protein [Candidatus Saccharibacteria bacterium]